MKIKLATLFVAAVLLYMVKLGSDPGWGDPWELSISAYVLGITHPPGYPLIVTLIKFFQMLPISAYPAAALLSLFAVSVTTVLIAKLVIMLSSDESDITNQWLGIATGLVFLLTPLALHLGTVIEVYAPATALALFLLYNALADWRNPDIRRFFLGAFVMGLSLTAHMTILLILPTLIIIQLKGKNRIRFIPMLFLYFFMGFSVSLMQPIRAKLFLITDWAHPFNWERWLAHITAAQYQGFWGEESSFAQWGAHLLDLIGKNSAWGFVPLALGGIVILFRKHLVLAISLAIFWLLTLVVPSFYQIWDLETYYLPWIAITLILNGVFITYLAMKKLWRVILVCFTALAGLVVCLILFYIPFNALGRATLPYGRLCLTETPYRCIVFSIGNPSLVPEAMQAVEGLRPDVVVISRPRLLDYWYWRSWEKRGYGGLPTSDDIQLALLMAKGQGLSDKNYLARAALALMSKGWQGMHAVGWTAGPDLMIENYPPLPELRSNWPIWLWRREPYADDKMVENVLKVAREGDAQGVLFFKLELKMAEDWARRWGDLEKAEKLEQWRSQL